jgi:cellulose synthase/poly-beta-1,6-N-acetylglucosamine synthase-like glycosyltransferase
MAENISLIVLLAAFGLLFYTYALYPALLWLLVRRRRQEPAKAGEPADWPAVSVLVSAYNEEDVIAERLENLLGLDYPAELLEILVGSDGSTDATCQKAALFADRGIRLFSFAERRGKASVLNDLVSAARGEVLVLTDANTFFDPAAVRELVQALRLHTDACAVVGKLDLRSSARSGNLDGLYWRYETWIKTQESRLGAVLGANGAIYAFPRARYQPIPQSCIVDDFLIPMLMRQRLGGKIFFIPTATAWERSPDGVRDEFRRRVRIGAGDLQALGWTWRLLLPWKGPVALAYFSHKVVRWLGPWLLAAGFTANLFLLDGAWFRALLAAQILFYALGLAAALFRRIPVVGGVASAARYFVILNAGLLLGFARFAFGFARPFWSRAPRGPVFRESPTSQ